MNKDKISLSDVAAKLLIAGLSVIIAYLIYIVVSILTMPNTNADVLKHVFAPQLEHILMSLMLVIGGSLLLDITIKEIKKSR